MTHAPSAHRNRLANEPSPYLKQHESNPVDWYPWGDEALTRARTEDKPILLSVGYSACHWCHVMAHESFENEETAKVMNANFVNIKIDREERPDLDQLYQGVVQLMGRGGGWPLTVFLTPDLRPFYGGTYFPPAPRHGLPAFSALLNGIAEAWRVERKELEQQAGSFKAGLTDLAASGLGAAEPSSFAMGDIEAAARKTASQLDPLHGGFGSHGPKFPNPMSLALVLRGWRRTKDDALLKPVLFTLEKMALGGIYDQLGGGFHRYSVDERWLVPHFEKMLYDNAQLLHLYSEAMQIAPRPLWQKAVEETVAYLQREMTSSDGPFFAAQDADSEGEEGKFFVWREAEVDSLLPVDQAAALKAHFDVRAGGNFEHGTTIFEVVRPLDSEVQRALVEAARKTLFAVRAKRVAPGRDDKVLAGWNGLTLRALALASRVFGRPDWAALASRAASFIVSRMISRQGDAAGDTRLARSFQDGAPRLTGMLEDYGNLAAGLVALYQATFEARYLAAAEALADSAVAQFWDESRGAYLAAPKTQTDLLVPTYALHDNASPSGASSLTEAHVVLAALTGRTRHLDQAERYLSTMRAECLNTPMGYGHLLLAADAFLDGAAEVTVVGEPEASKPFMKVLDATYLPTLSVQAYAPSTPIAPVLSEMLSARSSKGHVAAYLCQHFACQAPVTSEEAFAALISPMK